MKTNKMKKDNSSLVNCHHSFHHSTKSWTKPVMRFAVMHGKTCVLSTLPDLQKRAQQMHWKIVTTCGTKSQHEHCHLQLKRFLGRK